MLTLMNLHQSLKSEHIEITNTYLLMTKQANTQKLFSINPKFNKPILFSNNSALYDISF